MKKWIAKLMAVLMVFTCIPANVVNAETQFQVSESKETLKDEKEDAVTVEEEQPTDERQQEEEQRAEDRKQEAVTEESAKEKKAESVLNYLYINQAQQQAGEEQEIVVSWGEGTEAVHKMTLAVQDEQGKELLLENTQKLNNTYLFRHVFEKGIYHISKLIIATEEGNVEYSAEELEVNAFFGVEKEYTGDEKSKYIEMESAGTEETDAGIETSIVTIDEKGREEAKDSIADAIAASTPRGRSLMQRDKEVVVVLDPGHDARCKGASGNGVQEEVATLKIAQYCREELQKYAGVTVFLTREGAACPFPNTSNNIKDIRERVKWAKSKGADIFVSIHLNSSPATSANGAEVYYPSSNNEAKKLAQKIEDELVALGLYDRKIKIEDEYAVIDEAKKQGFPGLIVEHAFLSNKNDADKYLKTEAGLKKLGVADAQGIVKYFGLSKTGNRILVPEGTYMLENVANPSKSVSVSDSSFNKQTPVVLNPKKGIASQRFELVSAGGGYYYITAEHSGKAIDVRGGSAAPGAKIQQYNLNTQASAQQWGFVDAGGGTYYLQSKLGTYMEAVNGTELHTAALTGTSQQKWKLVEADQKPVKDGTYTISTSRNGSMVLDIAGGSLANKANVQLYKGNNSSAQRFEITHVRDGYYRIMSEKSGKVLDVSGGSNKNGANLWQYGWNGSDAQLWKFIDAGNGMFYIRSKKNTTITLASANAVSKTNVHMWEPDGSGEQKWKLTGNNPRPIADGEYTLVSAKATFGVATVNNTNVQMEIFDNSAAQKFNVRYVDNGYYKILSKSTGKALYVANGSASAAANLQQYNWNGTDAQLWKFIDAGSGSYYIKSKLGTVVELQGGKTAPGTNIRMYTMNDTIAQKWIFDKGKADFPERPFENGTYTIKAGNNESLAFDVEAGSRNNSANVRLYNSNNTSAQKYEFYYVGNGYYKILAEHSDKSLDVKGASNKAGANVQQYNSNGTDAQLWKFIPAGNGKYYIKSKKGTVIDLASGKTALKSNIQMNTMSGAGTQQWKIAKASAVLPANGTYSMRSNSSVNLVLNVAGGSAANLANVCLNTYTNAASQKFDIQHIKDGYYKITAKHSGKVLDADANNYRNGSNVRQNSWNGTDGQLWKFVKATGGGYHIKSKLGRALDVQAAKIKSGTNIQMYNSNGTEAQKWALRSEHEYQALEIKEGTYTIQSAMNANRVLDIAGGSTENKANVQLYTGNDSAAQKFKIYKVSGGYYRIMSEKSGKALDLTSSSMLAKANVQQYSWTGVDAQLWRFIDAGNGQVYIQSKLGNVLDISGGKIEKGTNIQAYPLNNTIAQKWVLDDNRAKLYKIMGKTTVTRDQMVKLYQSKRGNDYPYVNDEKAGAKTIEEFCQIFIEECDAEGVKAEVAFSQSMLETGYLKFGGSVKADQYNFAGLGATDGGAAGGKFDNIRHGVRAQVQHLKAYASTEDLKQPCVDTRFTFVKRGVAEYVQWLGMQENPNSTDTNKYGWASSPDYGYDMMDNYLLPLKAIK